MNIKHYVVMWILLFIFSIGLFLPMEEGERNKLIRKNVSIPMVIFLRMCIVATCSLGIIVLIAKDFIK